MAHQNGTGRARGGHARRDALTAAQRSAIAHKAAQARHELPKATHGSPDNPLRIGDIEIPAYVLEDGTRVLSQRGLLSGIGMPIGGGKTVGEPRMVEFVEGLAKKGVDTLDLTERLRNPIQFVPTGGGRSAYGFEATV